MKGGPNNGNILLSSSTHDAKASSFMPIRSRTSGGATIAEQEGEDKTERVVQGGKTLAEALRLEDEVDHT